MLEKDAQWDQISGFGEKGSQSRIDQAGKEKGMTESGFIASTEIKTLEVPG